ncbi:MAG: hypothetical protein LQ341_005075 [Variospora aurantia]|nr:MAG: hypothetical protein LQ341_005075 [Variospora aurantia]
MRTMTIDKPSGDALDDDLVKQSISSELFEPSLDSVDFLPKSSIPKPFPTPAESSVILAPTRHFLTDRGPDLPDLANFDPTKIDPTQFLCRHPRSSTPKAFPTQAERTQVREASAAADLITVQRTVHKWKGHMQCFSRALMAAIQGGHLVVAACLLGYGLQVKNIHFRRALQQRAFTFMQLFLDHGYNINHPGYPAEPGILAEDLNDEHLTRWLLDHGADPNTERINLGGKMGKTPVSLAMWRAPWSTIQLLIERGGPETLRCGHLLWYAVQRMLPDRLEVMEYLLRNGAAADVRTLQFENRPEAAFEADWVLGRGTPLHTAARGGCLDAVKMLIAWGADPTQPDTKGRLPIDEPRRRNAIKNCKDYLLNYAPGNQEGVIEYLESLAERTRAPAEA